jgi:hypothetical protein
MQGAVVQLFNREENDPEWQERDELLDFEQYEERLIDLNKKIALTYNNEAAWHALVYCNYNPDSELGLWMIQQPQAVKLLFNMLEDSNEVKRGNASQLLAQLIQDCEGKPDGPTCSIVKPRRGRILSEIHQRIEELPDDQISFDLLALGICGTESDVAFLDDVIEQHKAKMVTQKSQEPSSLQSMVVWLCRDSQNKIKQRLASQQPK